MGECDRASRVGVWLVSAFLVVALLFSSTGMLYAQQRQTTPLPEVNSQEASADGDTDARTTLDAEKTDSDDGSSRDEEDPQERTQLEVTRDWVTIAAFVVGTSWACWVFFSGRPFTAYANVRVEATEVWRHPTEGARSLVRVSVQNVGRIRLYQSKTALMVRPVDESQLSSGGRHRVARTDWTKKEENDDEENDELVKRSKLVQRSSVFSRLDEAARKPDEAAGKPGEAAGKPKGQKPRRHKTLALEPGGELIEHFLVFFGPAKALKVQVEFIALPSSPLLFLIRLFLGPLLFLIRLFLGWELERERTFRGWAVLHAAQAEGREEKPAEHSSDTEERTGEAIRRVVRRFREKLACRNQSASTEGINDEPGSEKEERPQRGPSKDRER